MQNQNKKFEGTTEVLDGNVYDRCSFGRCRLVYRGGTFPTLNDCRFDGACTWHFEDAADRTLSFVRAMYHGMGKEGQKLVERMIAGIKTPMPGTQGPFH